MENLKTMDYKIVPEPVDMWKNFQNTNIIREMYKLRELTSLGQIFIHMTLLEEYSKSKNSNLSEIELFSFLLDILSISPLYQHVAENLGYVSALYAL